MEFGRILQMMSSEVKSLFSGIAVLCILLIFDTIVYSISGYVLILFLSVANNVLCNHCILSHKNISLHFRNQLLSCFWCKDNLSLLTQLTVY